MAGLTPSGSIPTWPTAPCPTRRYAPAWPSWLGRYAARTSVCSSGSSGQANDWMGPLRRRGRGRSDGASPFQRMSARSLTGEAWRPRPPRAGRRNTASTNALTTCCFSARGSPRSASAVSPCAPTDARAPSASIRCSACETASTYCASHLRAGVSLRCFTEGVQALLSVLESSEGGGHLLVDRRSPKLGAQAFQLGTDGALGVLLDCGCDDCRRMGAASGRVLSSAAIVRSVFSPDPAQP